MTFNTPSVTENTCPFLGLINDSKTRMSYPSNQNHCHHARPVACPGLTHQQEFCLSADFGKCAVFQSALNQPMPERIGAAVKKQLPVKRLIWMGALMAAVITVAGAVVWFLQPGGLFARPTNTPTVTATTTPTMTPTVTLTVTASSTPQVASPTPSQAVILTPTPPARHTLETPFGSGRQFIIHRVDSGESLDLLVAKYKTSSAAILAVNYNLKPALWVYSVVVIPTGGGDIGGVPPMTAQPVEKADTSMKDLAAHYKVDVALLCALNDLPADYRFQEDEWVLIPHVTPTP